MASFPLGGKMNLQTPTSGPPCTSRPWNALSQCIQASAASGWKSSLWGGGGRSGAETSESRARMSLVDSQSRSATESPFHFFKAQAGREGERLWCLRQPSGKSGTMKLITSLLYSLHHRFRNDPGRIRNAQRTLLEWESIISPLKFLTYPYTVYLPDS